MTDAERAEEVRVEIGRITADPTVVTWAEDRRLKRAAIEAAIAAAVAAEAERWRAGLLTYAGVIDDESDASDDVDEIEQKEYAASVIRDAVRTLEKP